MEKDISNITWLLVNTEIQDLLIKSALEFGKNKDRLEYKFIATIPIIIFISFVKVLYYYFFQFLVKYNGSNNTISAIILKVGRGYDQNNIYKVANINVNECIYIEAFNFKEFMSVERVSFFALIKAFIRSLNDYYLALKLAPTVVIRKILFRNSTKYIHSYSYLTTFFQQIKFKYEGCTIYSGGAAFAFDAAIRAKLKTEYMHHGLMNKVYPDVVSNYGSIYVYSKDEAVYLKRTGVNSNIYTYRYSKIESHKNTVIIFMSPINGQINKNTLLNIFKLLSPYNYKIYIKPHPFAINKYICTKYFKEYNVEIINPIIGNSAVSTMTELKPKYVFGLLSTSLCEALNIGVIPIHIDNNFCKECYLIKSKTVYNFDKRSVSLKDDIDLIKNLLSSKASYNDTINSLIN